ncbi:leucine-rich repeat-containing protein 14 [Octopus bimaculoides]|uniref:Leucine-rich repeat-containing protein 14 n=1 Tax=Octopus bimaculoides TaxID=37653 RepID=A0A0L8FLR5_OCTBM|nr:leucine-rich repeat-containing protein 14 [Octopus bimaculoides]XP_052822362.1 leucine-rich repeat-containing protein 14 [Octopus bimaculoides]XP_052822363.1 leucine-rich repeat-containing protein 14 [Octopus bimaculoides]XP_052822364.1 leucine-rich repeat-containing protein 14 [Octopus bimaculoides]|eukprot:XP_014788909.1 PREDICTED: leucine-rich repeat-containing protein 14-like [Octopus bimaculoides]
MLVHHVEGVCTYTYDQDLYINTSNIRSNSLLDLCCQYVVQHASLTLQALDYLPSHLYRTLTGFAVVGHRDRALNFLLPNWPDQKMSVFDLVHDHYTSFSTVVPCTWAEEKYYLPNFIITTFVHKLLHCLERELPLTLQLLDLSGFNIDDPKLLKLCEYVIGNQNFTPRKNIQSVAIRLNAVLTRADTFKKLGEALAKCMNCRLKIQINRLDIRSMPYIVIKRLLELLSGREYIHEITLRYNHLMVRGVVALSPFLRIMTRLTHLDLSCNNIRLQDHFNFGTQILGELFAQLSCLKELNMSNNWIKGNLHLLLSRISQPLESLCISGCSISIGDLNYLSKCIHTTGLIHLDLSENNLSDKLQPMLEFLSAARKNLKHFEVQNSRLSSHHMEDLGRMVCQMEKLEYLNLCSTVICESDMFKLLRTICNAANLKHICFTSHIEMGLSIDSTGFIAGDIPKQIHTILLQNRRNTGLKVYFKITPDTY